MTKKIISYLKLNDAMRPDFRNKVIIAVLDYREKVKKEDCQDLDKQIRMKIKNVKGANNPNPVIATTNQLIEPCKKLFQKDEEFISVVLQFWARKNHDLYEKVEAFLISEKSIEVPMEDIKIGFGSYWPTDGMEEYSNTFLKANPDYKYDDVALMMSYLSNRAPNNADQQSSNQISIEIKDKHINLLDHPIEIDPDKIMAKALEEVAKAPFTITTRVENRGISQPFKDITAQRVDMPKEQKKTIKEVDQKSIQKAEENNHNLYDLTIQLNQAQKLVADGNFDGLDFWLDEFKENIQLTRNNLDRQVKDLLEKLDKVKQTISGIQNGDKNRFSTEVKEIEDFISKNPYLGVSISTQHLGSLQETIRSYQEELESAHIRYTEYVSSYEILRDRARKWNCDDKVVSLLPKNIAGLVNKSQNTSLEETKKHSKKVENINQQILTIIENEKQGLFQRQKERINSALDIMRTSENYGNNPKIKAALIDALVELENPELNEDVLLQFPQRILDYESRIIQKDFASDIKIAAQEYLKTADGLYLEQLLNDLWLSGRNKEASLLLASSIHGAFWEKGKPLPPNGLISYLDGLISTTEETNLIDMACSILEDRFLTNLVNLDSSYDHLFITLLCSAIKISRPYLDLSDILWYYCDETEERFNAWMMVAREFKRGSFPDIIYEDDLNEDRLKEIAGRIEFEFQKEAGKYIRLATAGDPDLFKVEQKTILPELEKKWRNFIVI